MLSKKMEAEIEKFTQEWADPGWSGKERWFMKEDLRALIKQALEAEKGE